MTVLSARQVSLSELLAATVFAGLIVTVDTQVIQWPWPVVLAHVLLSLLLSVVVFRSVVKARRQTARERLLGLAVLGVIFSVLLGGVAHVIYLAFSKTSNLQHATVVLRYKDESKYTGEISEELRAAGRSTLTALGAELKRQGFKQYAGSLGPEYVLTLSKRSWILVRATEVFTFHPLNQPRRKVAVVVSCQSTGWETERHNARQAKNYWDIAIEEMCSAQIKEHPDVEIEERSIIIYYLGRHK